MKKKTLIKRKLKWRKYRREEKTKWRYMEGGRKYNDRNIEEKQNVSYMGGGTKPKWQKMWQLIKKMAKIWKR